MRILEMNISSDTVHRTVVFRGSAAWAASYHRRQEEAAGIGALDTGANIRTYAYFQWHS